MDEFDHHGHVVAPFPPVAAEIGGGEQQQRPEALAPAADNVMDNLRDQADIRAETRFHALFHTA